jgi:adenosylcobinamide kinase/adenosylcobinamide-phosphate guanylyltransferase
MSGRFVLIGGGARSGKSAFALRLARSDAFSEGQGGLAFVATAEALDDEMRDRIRRHREERGAGFETIEEALDLVGALGRIKAEVVVIDCLTLWISNLLCRGDSDSDVLEGISRLQARLAVRDRHFVVVTNETGLGLVPDNPLGRRFRDLAGTMNQRMARTADEVYFGAMGLILRLKPGPVIPAG